MENGVDMEIGISPESQIKALKAENNIPENIPVFLFVGRMMWYKGIKIILDALSAVKNEYDFRMVFVGDGTDKKEIERYAQDIGVTDRCIFTGAVHDRDKLRQYYSLADMFLFPSTYDTNGIVVREAVACSLASVLIKGSCAAEGVTDNKNGILIEENAQSMAEAIRAICKNPEKAKALGDSAMRTLYISWEDSIDNAYKRYEEIVSRPFSKKPAVFSKSIRFVADTYKAFSKVNSIGVKVGEGVQTRVKNAKQAYKDEYKRITDKFDESDRYL